MKNLKKISRIELNNILGSGILSSYSASCPGGGTVSISDLINIGRKTTTYGDANDFIDRLTKLKKYKKEFRV